MKIQTGKSHLNTDLNTSRKLWPWDGFSDNYYCERKFQSSSWFFIFILTTSGISQVVNVKYTLYRFTNVITHFITVY